MIFDNYNLKHIMSKLDVLLAIHNVSVTEMNSLTDEAQNLRSMLKFLLVQYLLQNTCIPSVE